MLFLFYHFCLSETTESHVDDSNKENFHSEAEGRFISTSDRPISQLPSEEPPYKKCKRTDVDRLSNKLVTGAGLFSNFTAANSDYLLKLKSTVGIPTRSNLAGEVQGSPTVASQSAATSGNKDSADQELDMSIVKVEKEDGIFSVESSESQHHGLEDRRQVDCQGKQNFSDSENSQSFDDYLKSQTGLLPKVGSYLPGDQSFFNNNSPSTSLVQESYYSQGNTFNRSSFGAFYDTSLKIYKCQFCDKEFREKTNLRVHLRTHTGEKPYHCGICGKDFAHSSNLKQHERGVHKLPPRVPQYKQHFYNELSKMMDGAANMGVDLGNQSLSQKNLSQPVFPMTLSETNTSRLADSRQNDSQEQISELGNEQMHNSDTSEVKIDPDGGT